MAGEAQGTLALNADRYQRAKTIFFAWPCAATISC